MNRIDSRGQLVGDTGGWKFKSRDKVSWTRKIKDTASKGETRIGKIVKWDKYDEDMEYWVQFNDKYIKSIPQDELTLVEKAKSVKEKYNL